MIYTRKSNQVDGPTTTAVSRRTDESNTSESSCLTEEESSTMSDSADGSSQSPSTYLPCPYHIKRKYLIDHYCQGHGCRVCLKCGRKSNHRNCKIVAIDAFINAHHTFSVDIERIRHGYQICPYHNNNKFLIDHFCKDHTRLLCHTCARRKHSKCKVCSVISLSRTLNLIEEVKQFKRPMVTNLKGKMLLLKERLERHVEVDFETEHQKVFNEAVHWFQSNTRKDADAERILDHITADLAKNIRNIDNLLLTFNNTFRKLESSEATYKNDSEKLLIAVHNLVPDA